ncbi:MAG: M20/M25/M40 family metallo-hydrolase [candidate division KSB1 bacterium]|nr:M20/M25/M40 family metallo-hydrolase [candidate division KSB1 bacterium]
MNDDLLRDRLRAHIQKLAAELPHRGSATLEEARAHQYCADVLRELGFDPEAEEFMTTASAYRPFILASGLLLLSYPLFATYPWLATALALLVTVSAFMELMLLPNLLTWVLPKKLSRNLIARIPASHKAGQTLIIMSHVDSHRTPWIFRKPLHFRLYQLLSTLAMLAFVGLPLMYGLQQLGMLRFTAVHFAPLLMLIAIIFLMTLQAEWSPYTVGANDNASGVALLLELARQFRQNPLAHQDVWLVITGCEEVGAHGSRVFVKNHRNELQKAAVLVIDNIAGKDTFPCYYRNETMLLPMVYPEDMVQMAESVAKAHPELGARPFSQRGAYTDGTPVLQAGLSCISIVNHTSSGWIPYWHHPSDTLEHIDWQAYERSVAFIQKLIEQLEKRAAAA